MPKTPNCSLPKGLALCPRCAHAQRFPMPHPAPRQSPMASVFPFASASRCDPKACCCLPCLWPMDSARRTSPLRLLLLAWHRQCRNIGIVHKRTIMSPTQSRVEAPSRNKKPEKQRSARLEAIPTAAIACAKQVKHKQRQRRQYQTPTQNPIQRTPPEDNEYRNGAAGFSFLHPHQTNFPNITTLTPQHSNNNDI